MEYHMNFQRMVQMKLVEIDLIAVTHDIKVQILKNPKSVYILLDLPAIPAKV